MYSVRFHNSLFPVKNSRKLTTRGRCVNLSYPNKVSEGASVVNKTLKALIKPPFDTQEWIFIAFKDYSILFVLKIWWIVRQPWLIHISTFLVAFEKTWTCITVNENNVSTSSFLSLSWFLLVTRSLPGSENASFQLATTSSISWLWKPPLSNTPSLAI